MLKSLLRWLLLGLLVGMAAGAVAGLVLSRFVQLPAVEALTVYQPSAATQVRAANGSLLATFAAEKRIPLPPEQIPQLFKNAVLAAEDADFYSHPGIDPKGVARAVFRNIFHGWGSQGASTLTQQLARTLFLTPEKRLVRKLKEALLAIEIEQRFSKDQILALYCNQMYFGHGLYGVEAAARFFFGKPIANLSLPDTALLAGILQRNVAQSPLRHPDRALARRNYVLRRMLEEGMIDTESYEWAVNAPLTAAAHYDRNPTAAYYIEEVRRTVEERFGTRSMLEGGLKVETTLDPELQSVAETSLQEGLVELQKRLGWPGARVNLVAEDRDPTSWSHPSWPMMRWREGEFAYAVVDEVEASSAKLHIAGRTATLTLADASWTRRPSLIRLIRAGDVVLVRLGAVEPDAEQPVPVTLEAEPTIEGALVAIDNRTGAVLAMVGGFDFDRSQWNRATQAARQCGSAFKPFVYLAAFERGMSPNDTMFDGPVLLPDEHGDLTYCPLNYYRRFDGIVTLRYALEHSLNVSAVKLQQMITGEAVIDVARRLGIEADLHPYPSMALGSFELPLDQLTAAYAGIANRGQVPTPYLVGRVTNANGTVVDERRPSVHQALRPDIAYLMTHVLEGVVQRGTGISARELPGHLAGKTGTTDQYTDAWFVGFSPRITCGVWVGRDVKERIGRNMTGAEAALPTWIRFMSAYLEKQPLRVQQEEFPVPGGVSFVTVDPRTGLRAVPSCGDNVILESILETHPIGECDDYWHSVVELPWEQQLEYYTFKPGEIQVTPEAVLAAALKLEAKRTERSSHSN